MTTRNAERGGRALFIGRSAELARLDQYWIDASSGKPQVVLVAGRAGFGKTALLGRIEGRMNGCRSYVASCDEAESRVRFGLLDRVVRGLESDEDRGLSSRLAGARLADPIEIGSRLVQLLGDAQESSPLALLVDDAGYADLPSLQALAFALRRLATERALVVLTARPEALGRLPPGLVKLATDRERLVELRGLGVPETRCLVAELGGPAISGRAARRLVDATAGSPLHLRALIAELSPDEISRSSGPLPALRSFAALVDEATAASSTTIRCLLEAAAILGSGSSLETVATVGELDEPLEQLEQAVRTGLVTADRHDGEWQVGFSHPLIRSAIYEGIGPATRARLHRRAAAALPEAAALVHRVAAADGPDQALVDDLRRQATAESGQGQAASAADRLLAASGLSPSARERERLLAEAVDLLLSAGEVGEASEYSDRIAELPPTPERLLVQARLAWLTGRSEAEELARHVWIRCGASQAGSAAAAIVAQCRVLDDDGPAAATWAARALACSDLPSHVALAARLNLATGLLLSGRAEEAVSVACQTAGRDVPPARPGVWLRGEIRLWTDDLLAAYEDLRAKPGETIADAISPYGLMRLGFLGHVEYRLGRWAEALHHAERAVSLVLDSDQVWLLAFAHSMAVPVFAGRGMWSEAESHIVAALAAAGEMGDRASRDFAANAAAHLAHFRGDAEAVLAAAEPLRARSSIGVRDPGAFDWRRNRAGALIALKRYDEAERCLAELAAECAGRGLSLVLAAVTGLQGDLAMARRQPAVARECYEHALALDPDRTEPFARARIEAAYGRLLRRAGDRRAATDQLTRARDTFVQLAARPDLERCVAELAANGVAVAAPQAPIDARLTPQERAVARLVCAGRTNREVAAELVLSVKTVGYHLQNVYAKLGVNSRTQLLGTLGPSAF